VEYGHTTHLLIEFKSAEEIATQVLDLQRQVDLETSASRHVNVPFASDFTSIGRQAAAAEEEEAKDDDDNDDEEGNVVALTPRQQALASLCSTVQTCRISTLHWTVMLCLQVLGRPTVETRDMAELKAAIVSRLPMVRLLLLSLGFTESLTHLHGCAIQIAEQPRSLVFEGPAAFLKHVLTVCASVGNFWLPYQASICLGLAADWHRR